MRVVVPLAGLVLALIFVVASLADLAGSQQVGAMVSWHSWGQRAARQPLALGHPFRLTRSLW
jgi:hypothetical protein